MKQLLAFLMLFVSVSATAQDYDMRNAAETMDNVITGGQPSLADIKKFKAAGVKVIVNLRGADEHDQSAIKAAAKAAGIKYVDIPVTGASDLNTANAKLLDAALANSGDGMAVVHCASGNRVGNLLGVRAAKIQGKSVDEAIQIARKNGARGSNESLRKRIE